MLAKQAGSGVLFCLLITGAFLALIVDSERLVSVCKFQPYKTVLLNEKSARPFYNFLFSAIKRQAHIFRNRRNSSAGSVPIQSIRRWEPPNRGNRQGKPENGYGSLSAVMNCKKSRFMRSPVIYCFQITERQIGI